MVELRWYRDKEALAGGCKPVLQYRFMNQPVKWHNDDGSVTTLRTWSKWTTVPDVCDGDNGSPQ